MSGDWQSRAPGVELDFVAQLNCVHDLHIRETNALQAEIARLTSINIQGASATTAASATAMAIEKPVTHPTWLAPVSQFKEPAANKIGLAQASCIEENLQRQDDVGDAQGVSRLYSLGSQGVSRVQSTGSENGFKSSNPSSFHNRVSEKRAEIEMRLEAGRSGRAPQSQRTTKLMASQGFLATPLPAFRESLMEAEISELFEYGQQGQQGPKTCFHRLILSPYFDIFISVLIGINVIVLATETEYRGLSYESMQGAPAEGSVRPDSQGPAAEQIFEALEWAFGFVFWAELLVRVYCERLNMFKEYIAWVDVLVNVSWAVGRVGMLGNFSPTMLRVIRVLRVMRLAKVLRVIATFDSLQLIETACISSMSALLWFSVVLTLVLTFCALLLTEILHQYYFTDLFEESTWHISYSEDGTTYNMFLCFGTFTRSLFSMFELALANWPPLGRMLSEEVSQWFMLFAVGHKLVIGFAMVGVINGIFMQETMVCVALDDDIMVRQKDRQSKALQAKIRRLFKLADLDGNGTVCLEEFIAVLQLKAVRTWLCSLGFDSHDVETAFWMLAGDDGRITEQELIEGVEHLRGPARSIDVVSILTRGHVGKNAIRVLDEVRAGPGRLAASDLEGTISPSSMPSVFGQTLSSKSSGPAPSRRGVSSAANSRAQQAYAPKGISYEADQEPTASAARLSTVPYDVPVEVTRM